MNKVVDLTFFIVPIYLISQSFFIICAKIHDIPFLNKICVKILYQQHNIYILMTLYNYFIAYIFCTQHKIYFHLKYNIVKIKNKW